MARFYMFLFFTQGVIVGAIVSKYFKMNKKDTVSPSSNAGITGIYTAQKSYALFAYSRLYFDKDRWRMLINDFRDHVQYPTHGMFLNFKNQFYRDWVGSDYKFERYIVSYNQFFKLTRHDETQVLALRATFNAGAGIRFKMLPSQKVNIGVDGAVGKGDYSITFRIGEAFGR